MTMWKIDAGKSSEHLVLYGIRREYILKVLAAVFDVMVVLK